MKNRLRKMLSLVLAVVIAMSAISVNTLAAAILDIEDGSTNKLYVDWYSYSYNFNGRLNTSTYGQIIKLNVGSSTGQVAYCIQSSKNAWTSDYTAQEYYNELSRVQHNHIKHALIYGFQGTTKYGYNADTERIATQIVIWNICDGWFNNSYESTAVGIFTEGMSSSMATNVKACYNKIKEQMLSHTTIPSYAVGKKDTPTKKKMTTNNNGTFTITLTDSKNVSKYYDWQTAIKKYSYLSIITDTEGKLVIKSTKPIPSGSAITLTAKRDSNKYQNNIVDVAPMYMISGSGSQSSATFVTDRDPSTAKISIYSATADTAYISKTWEFVEDGTTEFMNLNKEIWFTIKNTATGKFVRATPSSTRGRSTFSGYVSSVNHNGNENGGRFLVNLNTGRFIVFDLPEGTYKVTEYVSSNVKDYTPDSPKTLKVTVGGENSVSFKNYIEKDDVKIVKVWTNATLITESQKQAINEQLRFTIAKLNADDEVVGYITATGNNGSYTYANGLLTTEGNWQTGSAADGVFSLDANGNIVIGNIPVGRYRVTEYGCAEGTKPVNEYNFIF